MSKEYWAEVSRNSYQEDSFNNYKHLEGLYLDYWQGKSILTELRLDSLHPGVNQKKTEIPILKRIGRRSPIVAKKIPSRRLSTGKVEGAKETDYRYIIRRYQRIKHNSIDLGALSAEKKKVSLLPLKDRKSVQNKFNNFNL
jgi:hypothetical protein